MSRARPVPEAVVAAEPRVHELGSPAAAGASEPKLCATPDGAVLMTWIEPSSGGSGPALRLASLRDGRWSPVLTVAEGESLATNWANTPVPCAFGEHGLAVAWLWRAGGDDATQLRLSVSSDGGGRWTRPVVVHDDREGSAHGFASLVAQGNGVRVVWLDGHNLKGGVEEGMADMTLHSRFVSESGTLGREHELDGRVCDCCPTAAVLVGTDVVVAYRDRSPEELRDISIVRLEGGGWSAPLSPRADHWKISGCPVNGPALAARGQRVAIAWYTAAADTPLVFVAFSANGGRRFGDPIRVDDGRPMGRVGVSLLADGSAVVSWIESGKDESQIRARLVREGERSSASIQVARLPGVRASQVPQLASAGEDLVMAWTEPGKESRVRVATLSPKTR